METAKSNQQMDSALSNQQMKTALSNQTSRRKTVQTSGWKTLCYTSGWKTRCYTSRRNNCVVKPADGKRVVIPAEGNCVVKPTTLLSWKWHAQLTVVFQLIETWASLKLKPCWDGWPVLWVDSVTCSRVVKSECSTEVNLDMHDWNWSECWDCTLGLWTLHWIRLGISWTWPHCIWHSPWTVCIFLGLWIWLVSLMGLLQLQQHWLD